MRVSLGFLVIYLTFGTAWSVAARIINDGDTTIIKSLLIGFGMASALAVVIALLNLAYDLIAH